MYWAEELAKQTEDSDLHAKFSEIAKQLRANQDTIVSELKAVQGSPADIGGYYLLDEAKASAVMRPSKTLNRILSSL